MVTLVNLDSAAVPPVDTAAVAALLSPIAPTITAASLSGDLASASGKPVTAITLRAEDLAPIEERLAAIPGVSLAPQARLLSVDKTLASPTFSGLSDLWQEGQDKSAGWGGTAGEAERNRHHRRRPRRAGCSEHRDNDRPTDATRGRECARRGDTTGGDRCAAAVRPERCWRWPRTPPPTHRARSL